MAGWGPYAYFRALEESRSELEQMPSNGINMQGLSHLDRNSGSAFDAMEAGRR